MHGHLAEALGREVEAEEVFAAAAAGDAGAADAVERALSDAGRAIATMALVLNPELVVIDGGVAAAGEALIAPLPARSTGWCTSPRGSKRLRSAPADRCSAPSAGRWTRSRLKPSTAHRPALPRRRARRPGAHRTAYACAWTPDVRR